MMKKRLNYKNVHLDPHPVVAERGQERGPSVQTQPAVVLVPQSGLLPTGREGTGEGGEARPLCLQAVK